MYSFKAATRLTKQMKTAQCASIANNRRNTVVQKKQLENMQLKQAVAMPVQMKANAALVNNPLSTGSAVMQLSKWQWDESIKKWNLLPDSLKPWNKKVAHRKPKHRDHPKYTANVKKLISEVVASTTLKKNQATLQMIMETLRPVNKLAIYSYLDDIPYPEFKNTWNTAQAGYPV